MLSIDRLVLDLPPDLRHRSGRIVRLVGRELAGLSLGGDLDVRRIRVPAVQVRADDGDARIAATIARAIHRDLASRRAVSASETAPAGGRPRC